MIRDYKFDRKIYKPHLGLTIEKFNGLSAVDAISAAIRAVQNHSFKKACPIHKSAVYFLQSIVVTGEKEYAHKHWDGLQLSLNELRCNNLCKKE